MQREMSETRGEAVFCSTLERRTCETQVRLMTYEDNGNNGKDHGSICLLPSEFRILITSMLLPQFQKCVDL